MLEHSRVKFPWPEAWGQEEKVIFLDELFLNTPIETMSELSLRDDPRLRSAFKEGDRLFAEWRTTSWTRGVNLVKKVAPSAMSCVRKCMAFVREQGHDVPGKLIKKPRRWAAEWRKRWRGFLGKLAIRDMDHLHMMRRKAPPKPNMAILGGPLKTGPK